MNPLQSLIQWVSALFNITRPATIGIIYSLTIKNPPPVADTDCGFGARWVNITVFPGGDDAILIFYDYQHKQINIGQPMVCLGGSTRSADVAARFVHVEKANTITDPALVQLEFWG